MALRRPISPGFQVLAVARNAVKDTTGRGDITELVVMTALVRRGKKLLRPISAATRYDVVIDNEDGTFTRIQCKTGQLRNGCVAFGAASVSGHNTRHSGYHGQIDAFGVYCPQTGGTYLVPIGALSVAATVGYLRVTPAKNGQRRRIRIASDYLISE